MATKEEKHIGRNNAVLLWMLEQPVLWQFGNNAGENLGMGQPLNRNLHVPNLTHTRSWALVLT